MLVKDGETKVKILIAEQVLKWAKQNRILICGLVLIVDSPYLVLCLIKGYGKQSYLLLRDRADFQLQSRLSGQ